ncbi:MAG: hypothetical protein KF794_02410 [Xanthobacteraceae bacterium]|nr:hypothetical protein [Xanthobacteraceae bacterium]QYK45578.1 MAG: hypothetical protein KF794_02410 [Xanthobacteraceae bacterium]HMN51657.1 hypothetical protein [Xanthobacteraceae bacterium]
MIRLSLILLAFAIAFPASAQETVLGAKQARAFIAGKIFGYRCFDGTTGIGRIDHDGSVAGTIRPGEDKPSRYIRLPVNTVYESGDQICATLRGARFSPCFTITKTSHNSFRGAIAGLGFMYCDFVRGGRPIVAGRKTKK